MESFLLGIDKRHQLPQSDGDFGVFFKIFHPPFGLKIVKQQLNSLIFSLQGAITYRP